jgi:hypothetical protein|tara:strand:- start:338 stop:631 length:294 start_codon:yes stop_codon:yes gene_type:complete
MKDKRTYTKLKEHGVDMTYENESKVDPKEDRGPGDLSLLIEQHKREIWQWRQKESHWIKTQNLAEGYKKIIDELSAKIFQQAEIIKQLEKELEDNKK